MAVKLTDQYVKSPSEGWGIVMGQPDAEHVSVLFENRKDASVVKMSALEFMDAADSDYILDGWTAGYPYATRGKGEIYAAKGMVSSVSYDPAQHLLIASVKGSGSNVYRSTIVLSGRSRKHRCSCPVGENCKHCYATLKTMKTVFESLRGLSDQIASGFAPGDPMERFPDMLAEIVRKCERRSSVSITDAAEMMKGLTSAGTVSALKELLRRLASIRSYGYGRTNYLLAEAVKYLIYNDEVRAALNAISSARDLDYGIRQKITISSAGVNSLLRLAEKGKRTVDLKTAQYLFMNERYDELVSLILEWKNMGRAQTAELVEMIRYMQGRFTADGYLAFSMVKALTQPDADMDRELVQALVDLLGPEDAREVYLSPDYTGQVGAAVLDGLPWEDFFAIASRVVPEREQFRVLLNRLHEVSEGRERETAAFLEEYVRNARDNTGLAQSWGDLLGFLKTLPDSVYLCQYMKSIFPWVPRTESQTEPAVPAEPDADALLKYFEPYWKEKDEMYGRSAGVEFGLISPAGKTAVCGQVPAEGSEHRTLDEHFFPNDAVRAYREMIRAEVMKRWGGEINACLERIREKKRRERLDAEYKSMVRGMNELAGKTGYQGSLSSRAKAKLSPEFSFGNQFASFTLKIGVDRMYIVKDYGAFLDMFRTGAKHQYGKNLELVHVTGNLADPWNRFTELLLMTGGNPQDYYAHDKREGAVTKEMLTELLETIKGRVVTVDGQDYLVRMEQNPFTVSVDRDMRLRLRDSRGRGRKLYRIPAGFLVLDAKQGVLDVYRCPERTAELCEFARRHDGTDITPVLKDFRERVYARCFDEIEIADEVKEEFALSSLWIGAYFDFRDSSVYCETKLKRGEEEISPAALSSEADLERYGLYAATLEEMGFRDGAITDEAGVLGFLRADFSDLRRVCDVFLSDSITAKKVSSFSGVKLRVQYDNDLFSVFIQQSEYDEEDLEQILRGIRRKRKYVMLRNDRIVALDNGEAEEFGSVADDLGMDPGALFGEKRLSVVQAIKAAAHSESISSDAYLRKMVEDIRSFKKSGMPLPKVKADVRPYQKEGFWWMSILSRYGLGGVLADDMGLGKTLEVIMLIASDKTEMPSLVVCPKSVVFNWKYEFGRFFPDIEARTLYGNSQTRAKILEDIEEGKRAVYVTSYDSLRNDMEKYAGHEFNYAVLDEAQFIKNVEARKSRSVKELKAKHRFALTGTPIENNVIDLWSIFDFVMPGYLEDLSAYKRKYGSGGESLESLAKRVGPFILRRTKKEVLKDLPDKYETVRTAEMTPEQRKYYEAQILRARQKLEEGGKAFDLLPYITRLRQVCVDPATFDEAYTGGSGKLQELDGMLDGYLADPKEEHKILIFSQFVRALNSVEGLLRKKGIDYYMLTGDTPSEERVAMSSEFNRAGGKKVFLVSLKAGGTGLNLVGADVVIHLDPWWNAAAEEQAADRAHRIGQSRNVEVIKLICEDSVEEKVIELQDLKKDIVDKVISKDDSSVTGTTLEDLAFLLAK